MDPASRPRTGATRNTPTMRRDGIKGMKITIGPRRPDADSELYALIPEACAEWVRYEPDDVDEVTRWYVGEDGTTTREIRFSPPEEK